MNKTPKRTFSGIIQDMRYRFLKRRILRYLNNVNVHEYPTREYFHNWLMTRKRVRIMRLYTDDAVLASRINNAIGDCITGTDNYIGYSNPVSEAPRDALTGQYLHEVNTRLKVTKEGRDYMNRFRIEMFFDLFPKTLNVLFSLLSLGAMGVFCRYLYNLFAIHFHWTPLP